jgi:hypothetical protein
MPVLARRLRAVANATALVFALSMAIDVISSLNDCSSAYREKVAIHTARIEEIIRRERRSGVSWPEDVERDRERIYFHALMRQKYEAASLRPWIPVPPDPAPPP